MPDSSERPGKAARVFYTLMVLLVALFAAFSAVLMHHGAVSIPVYLAMAAGAFVLLLLLSRKTRTLGFSLPEQPDSPSRKIFFFWAGLCALVMAVYLFAWNPGGFSSDTLYQWRQMHGSMPLTDWHPALHTLMMQLLVHIIDHPMFVLAVQNLLYALAVGWTAQTLARWRVPRLIRTLAAAYLCFNPAISNILCFPWKDCAFAVCALVLAVQLLCVHFSRGAWLASWPHRLALAVMLAFCTILRHNGAAMTLAASVWLFICLPHQWKRLLGAVLPAALLTFIITGPFYEAMGVEKQPTGLDETFGTPMSVLANIYARNPDVLDEETVTFLEDVAPRSVYVEHNTVGDWNDIKWFTGTVYFDKPYTLLDVYGFALRAAVQDPELAMEALGILWQMPMWPFCDGYWRISPYVEAGAAEEFGFADHEDNLLSRALNAGNRLSAEPIFSWLTWNPGFWLLAVMAGCALFAERRHLSALLLPAMMICYHLTTSLVLSSSTDFRFYLSTVMIAPLCLIGLAAKTEK